MRTPTKSGLLASIASFALIAAATPTLAEEAETLADAITGGKVTVDFRYRAENVDQDGFAKDAFASTLRTKLKYETGVFKGFSGVLEFDNVSNIGATAFNDSGNGKTRFPVIADPEITEVNQAYIAYTGFEKTTLLAGRTAVNIGNQRFVGTVGWRQNDQTWDMVGMINSSIPDMTITTAYIWNVNRVFGSDHPFGDLDTNTFVVDAKYTGLPIGNITAYGLIIDLNDAPVFGLSSKTFGVRFDGKHKVADGNMTFLYEAEYANQTDHASNATDYSADYVHLSAGLSANGLTGKVGFEKLGSDNGGTAAFQTPLATSHKFNGWADKFLGTPGGGLEDFYGSLAYKVQADGPLKGLKFAAIYHDFSAATGGNYGTEIDLLVAKKINKHYSVALKFADYNAKGFATDTQKIWFTVGAHF